MFHKNNILHLLTFQKLNKNKDNNKNKDQDKNKDNVYFTIHSEVKNILFNEKFPNLSFCDLKKLNDYTSTDDGCIYYKHKLTNNIYSWNYITKRWV
jgi:hypothetical protein